MGILRVNNVMLSVGDLRILAVVCDCVIDSYGYEKLGFYNVIIKFNQNEVIASSSACGSYSKIIDKVYLIDNCGSSKTLQFFRKVKERFYRSSKDPNVILIQIMYSVADGKTSRSFQKLEFLKMDSIETHRESEIIISEEVVTL